MSYVQLQGAEFASLPSLKTAAEVAGEIRVLSAERLTELAMTGYAPCWLIDGVPWFQTAAVRRWCAESFGINQPGRKFPQAVAVSMPNLTRIVDVPEVLSPMHGLLREVNTCETAICGVYFLVDEGKVVYVGQSVSILSRVTTHQREGLKAFDRAIYLPVPETDLDAVEGSFIRLLKPKHNGNSPMILDPVGTLAKLVPEFGIGVGP